MKQVTERCIRDKVDFNIAEKLLKLETHEQLGEVLLEKWQLPQSVLLLYKVSSYRENFRPKTLSTEQNKLINIMNLSDVIAQIWNAFQKLS